MYLMFPLEMTGKQCKSSFLSQGLLLKAPNQFMLTFSLASPVP